MALIKCPECEKEISDSAKVCPHCGYHLKSLSAYILVNKKQCIKIAGIISFAVIALLIIQLFSRPNLKMEDFDIENGKLETLFLFGIPDDIDNGEWEYAKCGIEFYGIPVENLWFDINSGDYYLLFNADYNERLESALSKYCKYSHSISYFDVYTYNDLEVWLSLYSTSGNIQIHR